MGKTSVDGKLSIILPEGFRVMGLDEVKGAFSLDYDDLWGARDEERHMMVAFIWKDAPELLGALVGTNMLVERAEKALRKTYKNSGYKLNGIFTTQVAGTDAMGFSYDFAAGNVAQQGEVIIFRQGTRTYTLYYYTRPECAEANAPLHDEVLASLVFEG